jgi:hypothetical protein
MNSGQWSAIGLSALILLWFLVGASINRRRGRMVYDWLVKGLSLFGKIEPLRRDKLLQAAAHLRVNQLVEPFRRMEVIYTLEPRENLPLWVYGRLSRRRDTFFLRADLKSTPVQDVEAGRKNDRAFATFLTSQLKEPYASQTLPGRLEVAWRGKKDKECLKQLSAFLEKYDAAILRFSLHRAAPHLTLKAELSPLQSGEAAKFLQDLQEVLV